MHRETPQKQSALLGKLSLLPAPHPVLAEGWWIWGVQHIPWWFLQKPSQNPAQSYSKILSCSWDPFFWMTSFWEKGSGMTASFPMERHRTHSYSQEWHRSMDLLLSPPTALKHPIPCITWIKPQHTFWKKFLPPPEIFKWFQPSPAV